jgi:hypothetical protein
MPVSQGPLLRPQVRTDGVAAFILRIWSWNTRGLQVAAVRKRERKHCRNGKKREKGSIFLTHTHTHTHTHKPSHTHTLSLSLSHTHTHTHSLSLSLSFGWLDRQGTLVLGIMQHLPLTHWLTATNRLWTNYCALCLIPLFAVADCGCQFASSKYFQTLLSE